MDHSSASSAATPCPAVRWENRPRRRYYKAWLQQNLFGDWELARAWGGIGSRHGGMCFVPVDDNLAGQVALAELNARRMKRGYALAA